ncbi:MAG: cytochrome c [Hyphomonadaceae bacterium]
MSACRFALAAGVLLAAACATKQNSASTASPHLGKAMTEAELAFWDSAILIDGSNLPAGSGSSAQGKVVYQQKCAACHGATGAETDTRLTPLVGGRGSLATAQPVRTLGSYWPYSTIVFDYIRRAMPYNAPKTLSNDEVYALTAYLLQANGIIGEPAVMDRTTLPAVQMPNRNGFVMASENVK